MHIGRPECARDLVVTYRWVGGDPGDDALVSFFAAYRAWVRAVVACERAAELADAPAAQTACEDEARRAPTVVERRAPAALLMRRADARLEAGRDPSDAGAAVVLRQIGECDPLRGRRLRRHLALRTDLPLGLQVSRVENFIDRAAVMSADVRCSPLVLRALRVATAAHGAPGHGKKKIEHPVAVAELIASRSFGEEVVAAALLHDTVEDTPLTVESIAADFGQEVAGLVAGVTEDARIHPYAARKAEARGRMMRHRRTAAIYAADKLASVRNLLASGAPIDAERLGHFTRTLALLSEGRPDLPFLPELAAAMAVLVDRESALPAPVEPRLPDGGRRSGPAA